MDDGMLIAEATKRLGLSEPTVRRHLGKELEEVPNSHPKRVTRASVERLRTATLERLGVVHEASHPQPYEIDQTELDELRAENEALRTVIQGLRIAHQELLDALGQVTSPRIPNH